MSFRAGKTSFWNVILQIRNQTKNYQGIKLHCIFQGTTLFCSQQLVALIKSLQIEEILSPNNSSVASKFTLQG